MTTFTSTVELGKAYKDRRTGIEGIATILCFQEHGCVDVLLDYMKDGKPEALYVNELRLVTPNGAALDESHEYESDLVLGHAVRDIQTRLQGWVSSVEFHEFQATRGIIRHAAVDMKGLPELKYHSIDDFLLEDVETREVSRRMDDKRSPATHEVERR